MYVSRARPPYVERGKKKEKRKKESKKRGKGKKERGKRNQKKEKKKKKEENRNRKREKERKNYKSCRGWRFRAHFVLFYCAPPRSEIKVRGNVKKRNSK